MDDSVESDGASPLPLLNLLNAEALSKSEVDRRLNEVIECHDPTEAALTESKLHVRGIVWSAFPSVKVEDLEDV